MKNRFSILLIFIFLVPLSSCSDLEQVVDIKLPQHKPRLVIECLFKPDESFHLLIFRSLNMVDTKRSVAIINAQVTLYENDIEIEKFSFNEELNGYFSQTKPISLKKYKIVVSAPDLDEVTAESFIPEKVKIKDATTQSSFRGATGSLSPFNSISGTLQVQFNDLLNDENRFYAFKIESIDFFTTQTYSNTYHSVSGLQSDYYPLETGQDVVLVTNSLFKQQSFIARLDYLYTVFINSSNITDTYLKSFYKVYLLSVSQEYYEYFRKLDDHIANQTADFFSSGNPVNVYSNIQNGYGIFAGYNEDVVEIK